jgi:predicted PurR-regulated permease PerM
MAPEARPVPVRTIMATIGLVLATFVSLYLVVKLAHVLTLLVVAIFFAVVLTVPVNFVRRHLHIRRGLAAGLVYLVGLALLGGMLYMFIRPLVDNTSKFVEDFNTYVTQARDGEGPLGGVVKRFDLDKKFDENKDEIQNWLTQAGGGAVDVARKVFSGLLAAVTIAVLSLLMILYGPDLLRSGLNVIPPPKRARVSAVAGDCARALTGYVMGNFLISIIAGIVTYIGLTIFGVPFKEVLAVWVAFADLIPLVGATLGAIPTVLVAFLHSTTAGIGMLVLYIVYQQFENHVLQVTIMAKTVQINQLFVLISVLIGVELFGFIGALLAIPAAGVIQVIARDLWDHRKGRWKEEPTVGADETPVDEVIADEKADRARERGETPAEPVDVDGAEGADGDRAATVAGPRDGAPVPEEGNGAPDDPAPTSVPGTGA